LAKKFGERIHSRREKAFRRPRASSASRAISAINGKTGPFLTLIHRLADICTQSSPCSSLVNERKNQKSSADLDFVAGIGFSLSLFIASLSLSLSLPLADIMSCDI